MPIGAPSDPIQMDPISRALARRANGEVPVPVASQVTDQAPVSEQPQPPNVPANTPQYQPNPLAAIENRAIQENVPKTPISNPEVEIILKALAGRLSTISNLEKSQASPPAPPANPVMA